MTPCHNPLVIILFVEMHVGGSKLSSISNFVVLLRQVEPQPGFIVRPLANLFGHVVNLLFNLVYSIGVANSLGFTIILMTIIFRTLMMPLSIKSQKSMMRMKELKPELDKIQEKYGNSKDPEIIRKMNQEKQMLMQKHDANPLKGCFPMLLQMPIFIGLNFIMRQAFLYIVSLREIYHDLARAIQAVPNYIELLNPLAQELIPNALMQNAAEAQNLYTNYGYTLAQAREAVGDMIHLANPADLARMINRFTAETWAMLEAQIPAAYWADIDSLNSLRGSIETFFTISMVEQSGFGWPQILLPVLTGITMLCSSWLMQQRTADPNADDKVKMQQKIMLIVMPLFMVFITFSLPAGVALFWVTSQVYQVVQDIVLLKKDKVPIALPFTKKGE